MNASKEEARKALSSIEELIARSTEFIGEDDPLRPDVLRLAHDVKVFIVATERKLPVEAAYAKDQARKKARAKQ